MGAKQYKLRGRDQIDGQPAELVVTAQSVPDAANFARQRGMVVGSVTDPSGREYIAEGDHFLIVEESRPAPEQSESSIDSAPPHTSSESGLYLLALLIPLIGLVAGAVRLANRDRSGDRLIWAAIVGFAVWALCLLALS
jgi:hypothetical protein